MGNKLNPFRVASTVSKKTSSSSVPKGTGYYSRRKVPVPPVREDLYVGQVKYINKNAPPESVENVEVIVTDEEYDRLYALRDNTDLYEIEVKKIIAEQKKRDMGEVEDSYDIEMRKQHDDVVAGNQGAQEMQGESDTAFLTQSREQELMSGRRSFKLKPSKSENPEKEISSSISNLESAAARATSTENSKMGWTSTSKEETSDTSDNNSGGGADNSNSGGFKYASKGNSSSSTSNAEKATTSEADAFPDEKYLHAEKYEKRSTRVIDYAKKFADGVKTLNEDQNADPNKKIVGVPPSYPSRIEISEEETNQFNPKSRPGTLTAHEFNIFFNGLKEIYSVQEKQIYISNFSKKTQVPTEVLQQFLEHYNSITSLYIGAKIYGFWDIQEGQAMSMKLTRTPFDPVPENTVPSLFSKEPPRF